MTDEYEYYSNNNMCNVCQAQWIVFNQKSAKIFSKFQASFKSDLCETE